MMTMKQELRVKCDGCIWKGMCSSAEACDDYTPADEMSDVEIEMKIEMRRDEYRKAWNDYTSQYE